MQDYRSVSKRFIILSVFYIVAGFTMLFWPHLTMEVLGKALGIAMLVIGLAYVVIYFTKDHLQGILEMDLTLGVILAAFGAFILLHGEFVGLSLPFAVGVVIMIGGISKIQFSLDMRRLRIKHWNVLMICSCLIILLGIVLVYNPFKEVILIYFIAGCLIFDGLLSIVSVLAISHRMKQISRGKWPSSQMPQDRLYLDKKAPNASQRPAPPAPHVDGDIMEDK